MDLLPQFVVFGRSEHDAPHDFAFTIGLLSSLTFAEAQGTAGSPPVGLQLMRTWGSKSALSAGGGANTMQDLKRLLSAHGQPSTDTSTSGGTVIYKEITYLMPLVEVRKKLGLTRQVGGKARITCAGLPDGLSYSSFGGVFEEGYTRMDVVTDLAEQVVSIQLVDEGARVPAHFWTEAGWHNLQLRQQPHQVPAEPACLSPRHAARTRRAGGQPRLGQQSGQNLEVSRWYVPKPLINLILHVVN